MTKLANLVICLLACLAIIFSPAPAAHAAAGFVVAYPNLKFTRPLFITQPDRDSSNLIFVVVQRGLIYCFPNQRDVTAGQKHTVLDIQKKTTRRGNEEGLLGLAFDPDWPDKPYIYVHYSAEDPLREVIARFTCHPKSAVADPSSEKILLQVPEPWRNHNGGMVLFGPDGDLYLSFGDGGAGGDPHGNAQNLATLKGSILRIDVHHQQGGKPYAIPKDNPFLHTPGARPEIYAYGLRNPWRFSFDAKTHQLWAGDVGQNKYEEVDLITKGGNYGWNVREGLHAYSHHQPKPPGVKLIDPIIEYNHHVGVSVTGGYVYRGHAIPSLDGAYIYADFGRGTVWMLRYNGQHITMHKKLDDLIYPASFGIDRENELYACCFDGHIYKLVPTRK